MKRVEIMIVCQVLSNLYIFNAIWTRPSFRLQLKKKLSFSYRQNGSKYVKETIVARRHIRLYNSTAIENKTNKPKNTICVKFDVTICSRNACTLKIKTNCRQITRVSSLDSGTRNQQRNASFRRTLYFGKPLLNRNPQTDKYTSFVNVFGHKYSNYAKCRRVNTENDIIVTSAQRVKRRIYRVVLCIPTNSLAKLK